MIFVIGEILFDQFPDKSVLGGAPFNFAFHLKKMGLPVQFVSKVGNDALGQNILNFLELHEFDLGNIQIDPDHSTGTVRVEPTRNGHTFHIEKNSAWDHLAFDDQLINRIDRSAELIYFGSLIQRSPSGKRLINQINTLDLSNAIVLCDINLRQNEFSNETIINSLNLCNMLKLNSEELSEIVNGDIDDPSVLLEERLLHIRKRYEINDIILTMGEKGSFWASETGQWHQTAKPPDRFIDSVGAGDAFAAVCAAGIIAKISIDRIIKTASWFSSQICGIQGALPQNESIYSTLIKMNTP